MRSDPVVILSVAFRQHTHLQQRIEDFAVQQLVPQRPVETLDVERPGSHPPKPLAHSPGRKRRPVVRANVVGHALVIRRGTRRFWWAMVAYFFATDVGRVLV